jgi:hypothetical protein
MGEGSYLCTQGNEVEASTGRVFDEPIDELPTLFMGTLLGFFRAVLECWETGVFAVDPHSRPERVYDSFLVNEAERQRIFDKYV